MQQQQVAIVNTGMRMGDKLVDIINEAIRELNEKGYRVISVSHVAGQTMLLFE